MLIFLKNVLYLFVAYKNFLCSQYGKFVNYTISPSMSLFFISLICKILFKNICLFVCLFIYFWLHWVLVAACRLSLVVANVATLHCGAWASHCSGFSCCRAWALGMRTSVVVARGLSSCGSRALECRLSSCGAWAQLLRGMCDLPRPGRESVSPALAGGFLTTVPPGKSLDLQNSVQCVKTF